MKTLAFVPLALICLAGCSSPPVTPNYGHPSLNNAQPPVQVYQVQQPASGYVVVPDNQPPGVYVVPAQERQQSNAGGRAVMGALAGGLIGSQFGGSPNARVAGAAAGAALGVMSAQGQPSGQALGGALVGGVIGSRFGGGTGRQAAAAAGAALGAWLAVPNP
jgi:uncharacterized protein YcfJ